MRPADELFNLSYVCVDMYFNVMSLLTVFGEIRSVYSTENEDRRGQERGHVCLEKNEPRPKYLYSVRIRTKL